jgi:hypothetical protein
MADLTLAAACLSLADDEEVERATALVDSVLFSKYLWRFQLWRWLDRSSKSALRGVSRAMCAQVEGSIGAVTSPESGFSSDELTRGHALATMARCPGLRDLTLLNVGAATGMQPLATASLAGVSLTMRQVGRAMRARAPCCPMHARPVACVTLPACLLHCTAQIMSQPCVPCPMRPCHAAIAGPDARQPLDGLVFEHGTRRCLGLPGAQQQPGGNAPSGRRQLLQRPDLHQRAA